MSNVMKYIKDLEGVNFKRDQAEAQVQVMLDIIKNLATKEDLIGRCTLLEGQIRESELRIVNRLGFVVVSCTTIAVMILTWLIKT